MKKISIIVPVYNVEPYISECIESLLAQTYPNIEIILLDNHSSDNSLDICYKYKETNDNIKVVGLSKNKGPSVARNMGVRMATGEYIGFCDSDDYVAVDMYEKMIKAMEEREAEYVIADMYAERIAANLGLPWEDGKAFQGDEIKKEMIPLYIGNLSDNDTEMPVWGSVVKCIFKKSIIDKYSLQFPENLSFAEDLVFTLKYLSVINCAVVCNKVFYHYRYNQNSLMNSYNKYHEDMWESRKALIETIKNSLKVMGIYEENKKRLSTSARAYIKECLGNACKFSQNRSFIASYKEVSMILEDSVTEEMFEQFDAKSLKNRLLYGMVKRKNKWLITLYYKVRTRG